MGRAADRWVSNSNALGWAGFALMVFVIVFVFLPLACEMRERHDRFPGPSGFPGTIRP